uniref:Retrovirus-related Env polyprotein from transposon gypsy n=1 Tax=Bactrocera latifrons TaxID=174628 RepID=A0A0K8W5H4_BACLA
MYRIIIMTLLLKEALAIQITNVKEKKYLLTETYSTYTYDKSDYLFHMVNLTEILKHYDALCDSVQGNKGLAKETAIINRINVLKNQLLIRRKPRSVHFLGSILCFVTGVPDHYDVIEIKEKTNGIVENNDKQRLINTHFEKLLEAFDYKTINQHTMLEEIHKELGDC